MSVLIVGSAFIFVLSSLKDQSVVEKKTQIQSQEIQVQKHAVHDLVRAEIRGKYSDWDDQITTDSINDDQTAIKGSWWMKDRWSWIAYKYQDNNWIVLVSFDGFDCNQVNRIPVAHNDFFADELYKFGTKYCYNFE